MKNSIKSFAFLFAAIAFSACTNQSIEPARPDTTSQITIGNYQEPRKNWPGKMITSDGVSQDIPQPEVVIEPTPHTVPIFTPYQKPRLDVMPVEQLEAGIN